MQGGPLMHIIAAKAIAFKEALQPEFKVYQKQVMVNAKTMAELVMKRGYDVVSGGTENHLFLLSLINKNITGQDALAALGDANITANKNSVPNDPRPPMVTSGLRLGTPAVTTRGFKEKEITLLTNWMCDILDDISNKAIIEKVKKNALELCKKFPVYEVNY
jgi:glycine hydroxymethyltransferase